MTALVHQCTYKKARRGDLGLELEVEAMDSLPDVTDLGWTTKNDGSLRYIGKEYITSSPIKNDDHKAKKIAYLVDTIKRDGRRVQDGSHRTSFHVHRNVSNWEAHMPWNAAVCYFLFENLLMKYCGKHREGNQFCLRIKDATSMIDVLKNDIKGSTKKKPNTPFSSFNEADIKYAGLNMKAIANYGSIEFRGMRGSLDPNVLDSWSSALASMTEKAAVEFKDPSQLMDTYFGHEPIEFFGKFFTKDFGKELLKLGGDRATDLIQENEPLVCELAYSVDWDQWKKKVDDLMTKGDPEWEDTLKRLTTFFAQNVGPALYLDDPAQVPDGAGFWYYVRRPDNLVVVSTMCAEVLARRYNVSRFEGTNNYFAHIDRLLKRGRWAVHPPIPDDGF